MTGSWENERSTWLAPGAAENEFVLGQPAIVDLPGYKDENSWLVGDVRSGWALESQCAAQVCIDTVNEVTVGSSNPQ
jgi:hypothetical protein